MATGSVIEVVSHGRDGQLCFKVDFGEDLGVQIVPVEDCKDWSPPQISEDEYHILDMLVACIKPQPFSTDNIVGKQFFRYEDVFSTEEALRLHVNRAGYIGRHGSLPDFDSAQQM
jgi:hypothetical protein